jgi:hypothetical protein
MNVRMPVEVEIGIKSKHLTSSVGDLFGVFARPDEKVETCPVLDPSVARACAIDPSGPLAVSTCSLRVARSLSASLQ